MERPIRPTTLAWLGLIVLAAAWIALADARRIANLTRLGADVPAAKRDDSSITGYAHGARNLVLPVNRAESQQWIIETEKMLAAGQWRAPRGDFDNAPEGRELSLRAPYRWWFRLIATVEHAVTGLPTGRAVEQAALHADPALHLLLCVVAGLLAAWRFGAAAGGILAAGIALLFAPTQTFVPGRPETHALFLTVNLLGLFFGIAGLHAALKNRLVSAWFIAAGAAAGLGLWLEAESQAAVVGAFSLSFLGALFWLPSTRQNAFPNFPWRRWAASGVSVAAAGWWIEGKATGSGLNGNHPLLWLAWLGLAETLVQAQAWRRGTARRSERIALAAGLAALLGAVAWLGLHGSGEEIFGPGRPAFTSASTFLGWLREEGLGLRPAVLLLAVLLIPVAIGWAKCTAFTRFLLCVAAGTSLVLLILAAREVRWWDTLTASLLVLLTVVMAGAQESARANRWRGAAGVLLLLALIAGWPKSNRDRELTPVEAHALIERDLAQWLAARAESGAVVLAPPDLSGALCYYGGMRVIGSPYPGNDKGRALVERIVSVASPDEAQSLVQSRYVHYIVLPSWDDTLERYTKFHADQPGKSLLALLRTWLPPRWLRPVPYPQPVVPGMEDTSVAVFEVVEPQDNAVALSHLADYFVEREQLDLAAQVADSLGTAFVGDAGGMIARARVALARNDGRTLALLMPELLPAIAEGKDEDLPWERRAQLAVVLAQTRHGDLARAQVQFCLQEADEERLRSLGPVALFRLLTLARTYRFEFADPRLLEYARGLLPPEFQAQLPP